MKHLVLGLALIATPALAQQAGAPEAGATAADSNRLALAQEAIDHIWPLGTYERMMAGTMGQMMDSMMESMMGMRLGDIVEMAPPKEGEEPLAPEVADATMKEAMLKADPHFEERMRITYDVLTDEMIPILSRLEPVMREAMAKTYAREFTATQLKDMNRFFATPSGSAYAANSLLLFMSPEMMSQMSAVTPELIKAMPDIMRKVQAATAHLPPPPKPDTAAGSEDETTG